MSTIYILWLRQLKRYFRSRARMIGSLGQPILFLVALGFGLGPMYAKAGGGNYIEFLAPGIIGMSILFTAMFSGIEVIWDRQFGFLKETLVAPVTRFKIMFGRERGREGAPGGATATNAGWSPPLDVQTECSGVAADAHVMVLNPSHPGSSGSPPGPVTLRRLRAYGRRFLREDMSK
jgi:hypothetical protein